VTQLVRAAELRSPAFAPNHLDAAFDYLQLDTAIRRLFRQTIEQQVRAWSAGASVGQ
jgi:hypothetical protein